MPDFDAGVTTRVETQHGPIRVIGEVHEHPCSYETVQDACETCSPTAIGIELALETLPDAAGILREQAELMQHNREEWDGEQPQFGRTGIGAALEYAAQNSIEVGFLDTPDRTNEERVEDELAQIDVSEPLVEDGTLQESAIRERLDALYESCPTTVAEHLGKRDAHIASRALGLAKETDGITLIVVGGIHALTLPSALDEQTPEGPDVRPVHLLFEDVREDAF